MERIAKFMRATNFVLKKFGDEGTIRMQCLLYVALNQGTTKNDIVKALGLTGSAVDRIAKFLAGEGAIKVRKINGKAEKITVPSTAYITMETDTYETRRFVYKLNATGAELIKELDDILK